MNIPKLAWQTLVIVGLVVVLLGAIDPLEGSVLILVGSGLVAIAALLGKSPQRGLLAVAFVLVAIGVAAMFAMSSCGGVGGSSGHSLWWLLTVLPYPIGWLMGLAGVVLLIDSGWHRWLVGLAAILSVTALSTLMVVCSLAMTDWGTIFGKWMPALVLVPHGLGLVAALAGGILWITQSRRVAAE